MPEYDDACQGCMISQKKVVPVGGIVELPGNWVVNHYGDDSEGFFGWMVLQPRYHRMDILDLTPEEACAMGHNIQRVSDGLRSYWPEHFGEELKHAYFAFFNESLTDTPPSPYHMHIHLIPRPESFDPIMREYKDSDFTKTNVRSWNIPYITRRVGFPDRYRCDRRTEEGKHRIEHLMDFMRYISYPYDHKKMEERIMDIDCTDPIVRTAVDELQRGNPDIPRDFWKKLALKLSESRLYYLACYRDPNYEQTLEYGKNIVQAYRNRNKEKEEQ